MEGRLSTGAEYNTIPSLGTQFLVSKVLVATGVIATSDKSMGHWVDKEI